MRGQYVAPHPAPGAGAPRAAVPDSTPLTRYVPRSCDSTRLARVPTGHRTRPITEGLHGEMLG